jgi:hypothetical protein
MPCTSSSEEEVDAPPRPQDQVLNPPLEPLPETVSRSVELRMLPQSQLIPPEEVVVEEEEDSEQRVQFPDTPHNHLILTLRPFNSKSAVYLIFS